MKTISLIFFLVFSQHCAGGKTIFHSENKTVSAAAICSAQAEYSGAANWLENDDDETDSEFVRQTAFIHSGFESDNFKTAAESSGKFIVRNLKPQRFLLYKIRVLRL